jgi:hypothetical protein
MIDSYILRQIADAQAMIDRLTSDFSGIQKHAEEATRYSREIGAMTARLSSPFEQFVLRDLTWTYFQKMVDDHNRMIEWAKRGQEDRMLISVALPKRGWYLSGKEPCTLSDRLAKAVREGNWDYIDQEMMKHLPRFKVDPLRAWLVQQAVPDHCINRLCRFLKHHDDGNYEEATYLGVPLLDEIAKHLYGDKTFTTKRRNRKSGDQSKPELAFKTASGPDLAS